MPSNSDDCSTLLAGTDLRPILPVLAKVFDQALEGGMYPPAALVSASGNVKAEVQMEMCTCLKLMSKNSRAPTLEVLESALHMQVVPRT